MKRQQKLLTDEQLFLIGTLLPDRSEAEKDEDVLQCQTTAVWKASCGYCERETQV